MLANRIRSLVRTSRAEDAVRRSEERYHNLIDTAPVPIVLFGQMRALLYANDAAVDFLEGESSDKLVGMVMTDFVHPDDSELAGERFASVMDGTAVGEQRLRIQTVDGTTKEGFVATAPGVYQGEPVAQAVLRQRPPS